MSVARFIADQRTRNRVPHVMPCMLLGVSVSCFYKWIGRMHITDGCFTGTDRRGSRFDVAVAGAFRAAKGWMGPSAFSGSGKARRDCSANSYFFSDSRKTASRCSAVKRLPMANKSTEATDRQSLFSRCR